MSERKIAFKGAKLIDGNGGEPVADAVLVVNGDRIEAVGESGSMEISPEAEIIDVTGKTILPD